MKRAQVLRVRRSLAAVAAAAFLMAACGDSDDDDVDEMAATTTTPAPAESAPAESAPAESATTTTLLTLTTSTTAPSSSTTAVDLGADVGPIEVLPTADGLLWTAVGAPRMDGSGIVRAEAFFNEQWFVTVDLSETAAADFDALAQEFFGKRLAIVIDGVVFSAPTINAAEFGGQLLISGDFEQADAAEMAAALSVDGSRLQFRPFVDEALQSEMTAEELAARAGG